MMCGLGIERKQELPDESLVSILHLPVLIGR
jgi:hypothetical protein